MAEATKPVRPGFTPRRNLWRRPAMLGAVLLVGIAAVLYGIISFGKEGPASCPAAEAATTRLDPLIHGEVAAFGLDHPARPAPELTFNGPDGRPTTLAALKGRTVLVNLWATWCVPCRTEMPALNALQAKLGGPDFEVVAVNVDTARLDRPQAFLKDNGIDKLAFYADPSADVLQVLKGQGELLGLPTTLLIDKHGCELGRIAGPADWASPDAQAMITAAQS